MGIKATQRRTEVPQLTSTAKIPDSERGLCTKGGGGNGARMEVAFVGGGGVLSTNIV